MPTCDHLNPERWTVRDGRATCPGCGRFMGRVVAAAKTATGTRARAKKSNAGAGVAPDSDGGLFSEGESDDGKDEREEA